MNTKVMCIVLFLFFFSVFGDKFPQNVVAILLKIVTSIVTVWNLAKIFVINDF